MRTKKIKSAGRFGARHGIRIRRKITEIESVQRKKQLCIFCKGISKRISKGIWKCGKCEKKFAGHTYFTNENRNN